jgi:hypothetical protein
VQPGLQALTPAVAGHHIKLGAIAGGQQHRLIDAIEIHELMQRARNLVSREDDLLANFDRCRVMVQPEYLQRHNVTGGADTAL